MKKLILILLFTFTVSLAFAANKLPAPKPTKTHLKLPAFSSIHVTGSVNLIIQGAKSKKPSDTVIESRNPQWVSAKVRNHVLYLRALPAAVPTRTPPTVKVRLYQLNKLDVYGRTSVTGKNIKSNGLYLRADTTKNITLTGNMVVARVSNYGSGHINLRWVKGGSLVILGLHGHIKLAGNVTQLRAKLRNHAVLDAQYLRAKEVLIQTRNFAIAKVLPIQSLRAFATDFSNVYYYKTPAHLSRYTTRSGNVLQLGKRN